MRLDCLKRRGSANKVSRRSALGSAQICFGHMTRLPSTPSSFGRCNAREAGTQMSFRLRQNSVLPKAQSSPELNDNLVAIGFRLRSIVSEARPPGRVQPIYECGDLE